MQFTYIEDRIERYEFLSPGFLTGSGSAKNIHNQIRNNRSEQIRSTFFTLRILTNAVLIISYLWI